jgi:protein-S-isoprenylcysteine O-methyltransferase Ste14
MFVLIRTLTYASLFIALVLVFVPAQVLTWSGITRPAEIGAPQVVGVLVALVGAVLALSCVFTFAGVGRGTPAPFDPPRRLVVQGPYRFVRNPMYVGATVALGGAALFYESPALLAYTGLFLVIAHWFVIWYEEPHLRRTFGEEYRAYCSRVPRWWPVRGER